MRVFFSKPLLIHFMLILLAYSIIFITSVIIYNQTKNSFNTYEEFLDFEEDIFLELKDFESKVLTKNDIDYIYLKKENINRTEYLENIHSIFERYIKEVDKFNADNLDDQLATINIKMKQVNMYIQKILDNPVSFKNIDIEAEIYNVIFLIYNKNNQMNYENFSHYSLLIS